MPRAVASMGAAIAHYKGPGITVERVTTDNAYLGISPKPADGNGPMRAQKTLDERLRGGHAGPQPMGNGPTESFRKCRNIPAAMNDLHLSLTFRSGSDGIQHSSPEVGWYRPIEHSESRTEKRFQ